MALFKKNRITHSYQVDGMHCGGCVTRVQKVLENLPGVKNVTVNLEPPVVVITAVRPWSLTQLNIELQKIGDYTLSEMLKPV